VPSAAALLKSPPLLGLLVRWARASLATIEATEGPRTPARGLPSPLECVAMERVAAAPQPLFALPSRFTDLYSTLGGRSCPSTGRFPEEPAICLACGELLCAGSACCKVDGVGALTRHVRTCSAGAGLFFLLHRCGTVLLRGVHAAYSISPYVDEHGEEDSGLRRGRPLHLDERRLRQLQRLFVSHGISGEVVRERVMRDRVIREAFY
jgi:hypothetical protein